ncbi:hypothetical protein CGI58_23255 [Vibrio parahaemolyticus]|nr:hypothetical protein CGI58_23255 [Vibrio parahaemolyticus]
MSRVIKKVGDEIALLTSDKVTNENIYGQDVFEAAFKFIGKIDHKMSKQNQPKPKSSHKPKH